MEETLAHQQALFHSVARFLDNFKKIGRNNLTAAKVRSRITSLQNNWSQCVQNHSCLLKGCPLVARKDVPYFKENEFDQHEDIYQSTLDHLNECLESLEPVVSHNRSADFTFAAAESNSFSLRHLPPIKLPPFSGKADEWETFRDRFQSLIIDNKELSDFSRMHFLVTSLNGSARDAIAGIKVTADSFQIAWTALTERFENKRRLVEIHIAALYNLPKMTRESATELHSLRDKIEQSIAALRRLDRSSENILSDMLVYSFAQKLDPTTRRSWKIKISDTKGLPTYEDIRRFVTSRAFALEEIHPHDSLKSTGQSKITSSPASAAANPSCVLCTQRHFLHKCSQFAAKTPNQRREFVKQTNCCFNCLSIGHSVQTCRSRFTCQKCQSKHHTLLHVDSTPSPPAANNSVVSTQPTEENANVTVLSSVPRTTAPTPVLLSTAKVLVRSPSGRSLTVRALLDSGAELTFITERAAQTLRLARVRTRTSVSGIGCVDTDVCRTAATIHISPMDNLEPTFTTTAYILKSLTKYVPRNAPSNVEWKHLSNLKLADDDPTGSVPIDVIIGADLYNRVLVGACNGPIGQPGAIQSHFGWVLSGTTSSPSVTSSNVCAITPDGIYDHVVGAHTAVIHHCRLEQELQRFWELEDIPSQLHIDPDEKRCEDHFLETHSRTPDGRYIVRLPFRTSTPIDIGESRGIAERRLASLIRRLDIQPDVKKEYSEFLCEYEQLNHMKKVSYAPPDSQVVYIPHHPVIRSTSSTTRLRVVFDASSRTTNGTSLNNHMFAGPKLQQNLQAILSRWRQHKFVYSADIAKMYRQILVDPRDCNYQRILWLENDSQLQEYQLLTVTYGTVSAPFLALRVLQQLNQDEGTSFPLASPILKNNIYVDDVLFGADDISRLRQARDQLSALLKKGGFELRKWASNRAELLSDICETNYGIACSKILEKDDTLKVLGIIWNPACDNFQFQVTLSDTLPNTKRAILSTIARLFDPLGWVTPAVLAAKLYMQQLWRANMGWDDVISSQMLDRWTMIYHALPHLRNVKFPRWTGVDSTTAHVELHGFSDASTGAYAAVVYLRVTSYSGRIFSTLLAGKSKVAPIKPMSVPRLELSAAVLLSHLIEFMIDTLNLPNIPIHCWTDSTVTLAWLAKHPSHWKTFVAHRVADIQDRLPTAKWRYIRSNQNPADCASRGLLGNELAFHDIWWHGPDWLTLESSEWPDERIPTHEPDQLEAKSTVTLAAALVEPWELASRYSWWPRLVRVTAYVMRFVNRIRNKGGIKNGEASNSRAITAHEFDQARFFWLRQVQAELFPLELEALKKNRPVPSKSSTRALHPFLDRQEMLRVGGRLENSPLAFSVKHPILLAKHPITELIVRYTHITSLHAGIQLTLASLRQKFWILKSRSLVTSVLHRCVACTRQRAAIPTQLMGQLPSPRVSASSRAFIHCGVDYAGPVATRASAGRGIASSKSYIALFVCLATRAIHLELVSNYTTAAFLSAYIRFCSRRGLSEVMYSDNGTTFVGADVELREAYQNALNDPNFLNRTAADKTSWKFIPPHAPHFGGLWEAGVKSVKHHLRRVLGLHKLSFEEFTTILCRIEACLNSRPLAPLTDAFDDYETLTPGHFLIGSAITMSPEATTLHLNENRLSRWHLLRHITERFWKLWQTDYVNTLQQRTKWQKPQPSISVGSIVLIQNPLLPPCKWELGRVLECHAGSDGLVRVVTVRTENSEYKRPITKLCLLPVEIERQSNETLQPKTD